MGLACQREKARAHAALSARGCAAGSGPCGAGRGAGDAHGLASAGEKASWAAVLEQARERGRSGWAREVWAGKKESGPWAASGWVGLLGWFELGFSFSYFLSLFYF